VDIGCATCVAGQRSLRIIPPRIDVLARLVQVLQGLARARTERRTSGMSLFRCGFGVLVQWLESQVRGELD